MAESRVKVAMARNVRLSSTICARLLLIGASLYLRVGSAGALAQETAKQQQPAATDQIASCFDSAAKQSRSPANALVRYGPDDKRRDIRELASPEIRANAEAVVLIIDTGRDFVNIFENKLTKEISLEVHLYGDTFRPASGGGYAPICPTERYLDQKAAYFACTGVFVAADVVMTAAHCFKGSKLADLRFIRNFRVQEDCSETSSFPAASVFRAKTVQKGGTAADANDGWNNNIGADWAFYRVDHEWKPLAFPKIRLPREGEMPEGTDLYVLGHPDGLPMKFAGGAASIAGEDDTTFRAKIDVFTGNSGSPIFNSQTHRIEGILHGGSPDWYLNVTGECVQSQRLECAQSHQPELCRGEVAARATKVPDWKAVLK